MWPFEARASWVRLAFRPNPEGCGIVRAAHLGWFERGSPVTRGSAKRKWGPETGAKPNQRSSPRAPQVVVAAYYDLFGVPRESCMDWQ